MKVVINTCHGGFSLSRAAFLRLRELGEETALNETDVGEYYDDGSGPREDYYEAFCREIPRNSDLLVKVVEELGTAAAGECAKLSIIVIPDDVEWIVEEYDGWEWIAEVHRTWPSHED